MKLLKSISPYLVIVGIIVLFGLVITSLINPPEITYTEFMRELNADNIEKVDLRTIPPPWCLRKPAAPIRK